MSTPRRVLGPAIADFALGVAIGGGMIAPLSVAIGGVVALSLDPGGGSGLLLVMLGTALLGGSIAFGGSYLVGVAMGSFDSTDPRAIGSGLGGLPLLAALAVPLFDRSAFAFLFSFALLSLGAIMMIGGYLGCRSVRPASLIPQHGIGTTCAACTYDLTATAQGKPCPECGGKMRISPESVTTRPSSNSAGAA